MGESQTLIPPANDTDTAGALRVLQDFVVQYQPVLLRVEYYLEQVMDQVGPDYAEAYSPWHKAVQDLFRGVYLMSKKIPLPDPESLLDALCMFTFDSAVQFLQDLCISCRLVLERDWAQRFKQAIDLLLFSVAILQRQREAALNR